MKNSMLPVPETLPVKANALPLPLSSISVWPLVMTSTGQPLAGCQSAR